VKLDAALGTEGDYLRGIDRTARAAEDLGFAGLWTSETKHDAFLPLAIAANETHQIGLGTSVAIAFSRSPMETAQTAWDRPSAWLREYILALRAIWESFQSEGPLNFEGDFYRHTLMTPFFDPGPIDHPEIPIYIAGVNTRLANLAGEICDGFHVHPFHSPEYVRRTVRPAIAEGARQANRDPEQVTLATSAFVITGENEESATEQRESVRSQISFYASTPTYRAVLEAHGWEAVGERLGTMAREKKWREMPALITDEMLAAFAIEAAPDEIGPALRVRYEGLIDRVALYLPFEPDEHDEFWQTVVESVN
jgi:probable F420-dependent oxidoreductase